jgi:type II secretory pathway predicted ATPase ExeA
MFQQFYGFTRLPFSKDIPPADILATRGQAELGARLSYLVNEQGMGLVTGEIGCGKSTAVRSFVASLDPNRFLAIYLPNPTLGITGLYRDILVALGYEPPFSKPRMVARIRSAFEDLIRTKQRFPLLILDEADLLPPTAFEQFRLLLSTNMDSRSLATLLLIGPPVLSQTLHLSIHESFRQRLTNSYQFPPLDLKETLEYIQHHLRIAGYITGSPFSDDALKRIFEYTRGLPRQINRLCITALIAGRIDQKQILDDSTVLKAIAEIDQG